MAKYWMGAVSTLILAIFGGAACSDAGVDIGEKNPQLAKSDLAAYAASWTGYVEAYQFEDKTDVVRLVLDEQGRGTLRFGERELFGPATDPQGPYPPQSMWSWSSDVTSGAFTLWAGFDYSVKDSRVESERIRLNALTTEVFSSYCALQTPYVDVPSAPDIRYKCIPYAFSSRISGYSSPETCTISASTTELGWALGDPLVDVDCEQLTMCGSPGAVCKCTATSCYVDTTYSDVKVDAALDDARHTLTGTLMIHDQRLTIHLTRD